MNRLVFMFGGIHPNRTSWILWNSKPAHLGIAGHGPATVFSSIYAVSKLIALMLIF